MEIKQVTKAYKKNVLSNTRQINDHSHPHSLHSKLNLVLAYGEVQ